MAIGSAGFMLCSDPDEAVEVGYGLNEGFRGNGYMTEALAALCAWAFGDAGVSAVTAETDRDNFASHAVLQKCGMRVFKETEGSLFWMLAKMRRDEELL